MKIQTTIASLFLASGIADQHREAAEQAQPAQ